VVLNDGPPAAEDAASAHTVSLLLADENRVFRPDPELPDNFPFADDPLGMQITPRVGVMRQGDETGTSTQGGARRV